jgi:hypothetical protein
MLGTMAAAAPVAAAASHGEQVSADFGDSALTSSGHATVQGPSLLAPLERGSRVAGCVVEGIHAPRHGAIGLSLRDESGVAFGLEVCARDASARAPGESTHHQVFVVNEGDGAVATHEAHGLAAMTVAHLVSRNEAGAPAEGLLTLGERLSQFAGAMTRPA